MPKEGLEPRKLAAFAHKGEVNEGYAGSLELIAIGAATGGSGKS